MLATRHEGIPQTEFWYKKNSDIEVKHPLKYRKTRSLLFPAKPLSKEAYWRQHPFFSFLDFLWG